MKVAIIGFSKSSYDDAPWDDDTWEKWGMPWDARGWERYTRLFEMHSPVLWDSQMAEPFIEFWDGEKYHRKSHRPQNYYPDHEQNGILLDAAMSKGHKVYAQNGVPEGGANVETSLIEYPYKRVMECIGEDYFQSSIAYAFALAITEIVKNDWNIVSEIALYGVDVSPDGEWVYQRANIEYLIGLARGLGIKVTIPETSALCKFQDQVIRYGAMDVMYTLRYGIIKEPQTFVRHSLGEKYSIEQLRKMDLPKQLKEDVMRYAG
jgi:hypothetical protein